MKKNLPKMPEGVTRCIECQKGINGDKSCGCGAFNTSPWLGCLVGKKLEEVNDGNQRSNG